MAGLINSKIKTNDPEIPELNVSGYDPERIELDPTTDTVEGRMQSIIDRNSPLAQRAEARSLAKMNKRGLVNSSIAVGAGQGALYDYALPIAQQDASTYANTRAANANAGNQSLASTSQAGQAMQQAGYQGSVQERLIEADTEGKSQLQQQAGEIDTGLQELRGEQAERLANIEATNRLAVQSSNSAALFYSQMSASITEILANPDVPAASKQALVDQQMDLLESGLAVLGGIANLDFGGLLDFGGETAATPTTPTNPASPGYVPPGYTQEQWEEYLRTIGQTPRPGLG